MWEKCGKLIKNHSIKFQKCAKIELINMQEIVNIHRKLSKKPKKFYKKVQKIDHKITKKEFG